MTVTGSRTTKKWTRARVPRVRTGCITWTRHIKCDERKPACRKCEEGKWTCEGYELNLTRKRHAKTKASTALDACIVPARGAIPRHALILPHLTLYGSGKPTELELLHHVRTSTAPDFASSVCPMSFWYIYALPLGHSIAPIKHALCALGSAHKSFKTRQAIGSKGLSLADTDLVKSSIEQYNQAIHQIKALIQKPSTQNTEAVLICCVIFMCIENLQGRYAEGIKHFQSAVAILSSLLELPSRSSPLTAASFTKAKQGSISDFYKTISHMLFRVGQDLSVYVGSDMIADLNFVLPIEMDTSNSATPFSSAAEAGDCLFSIQRGFDADIFASELENPTFEPVSIPATIERPQWLWPKGFPAPPYDGSIQLVKMEPFFNNWNARFKLYRDQLDAEKASKSELRQAKEVAILQAVWTALRKNKTIFKDFQREDCEEILLRAESYASEFADDEPVFGFDGTLVSSLTIMYTSCQYFDVQKRCIKILRSIRRREGIWETNELADILETITIARENNQWKWEEVPWFVPQLAQMATSFRMPHLDISMGALSLNE